MRRIDFVRRLVTAALSVDIMLMSEAGLAPLSRNIARSCRLLRLTRNVGEQLLCVLTIETARALGRTDTGPVRVAAAIRALRVARWLGANHTRARGRWDETAGRRSMTGDVSPELPAILRAAAFDMLVHPDTDADPAICGRLCAGLARSGLAGSMGGSRSPGGEEPPGGSVKAILRFSVEAGAILVSSPPAVGSALAGYGLAIGTASDLLRGAGGGPDNAARLNLLVDEAKSALSRAELTGNTGTLRAAADFLRQEGC